ncbi:hypothetical protein GPLA_0903 [Paraglaciecola polaris LMG 21857]|uniref:Uncharacterized protein n=1 Tax=Paraglaciecola polaris LMG 21857 TaxID=1129793 RepID=K6YGI6_9ALTE|nr:hypothetical protein GPLA_0903 [Paraglaciecola polaris LMG 21857]
MSEINIFAYIFSQVHPSIFAYSKLFIARFNPALTRVLLRFSQL